MLNDIDRKLFAYAHNFIIVATLVSFINHAYLRRYEVRYLFHVSSCVFVWDGRWLTTTIHASNKRPISLGRLALRCHAMMTFPLLCIEHYSVVIPDTKRA